MGLPADQLGPVLASALALCSANQRLLDKKRSAHTSIYTSDASLPLIYSPAAPAFASHVAYGGALPSRARGPLFVSEVSVAAVVFVTALLFYAPPTWSVREAVDAVGAATVEVYRHPQSADNRASSQRSPQQLQQTVSTSTAAAAAAGAWGRELQRGAWTAAAGLVVPFSAPPGAAGSSAALWARTTAGTQGRAHGAATGAGAHDTMVSGHRDTLEWVVGTGVAATSTSTPTSSLAAGAGAVSASADRSLPRDLELFLRQVRALSHDIGDARELLASVAAELFPVSTSSAAVVGASATSTSLQSDVPAAGAAGRGVVVPMTSTTGVVQAFGSPVLGPLSPRFAPALAVLNSPALSAVRPSSVFGAAAAACLAGASGGGGAGGAEATLSSTSPVYVGVGLVDGAAEAAELVVTGAGLRPRVPAVALAPPSEPKADAALADKLGYAAAAVKLASSSSSLVAAGAVAPSPYTPPAAPPPTLLLPPPFTHTPRPTPRAQASS